MSFHPSFLPRFNGVLAPEVPEAPGNQRGPGPATQFLLQGLVDFFGMKKLGHHLERPLHPRFFSTWHLISGGGPPGTLN